MQVQTLAIHGYHGELVPNTFLRQEREARHLAVLFPGLNYNAFMPLLYYPQRLLSNLGADVLRVETTYNRLPKYATASQEEQDRWLQADSLAAFKLAFSQRSYEAVTLLGKSIGTLAVSHLINTLPRLPNLQCIWLTPLLRLEALCQRITKVKHRALFIIGSADPQYDPVRLEELRLSTGGETIVAQDGEHSLEVRGDLPASLRLLAQVMEGIQRFLTAER